MPAGGDLQGAINGVSRGDVIQLALGATYFGPITLPPKSGSGWITIRTGSDGAMPPEGQRMTSYAGRLAKIGGGGANASVLLTSNGAVAIAIVVKSTNQGGTNPLAQTADVTFRYNIVRNSPQGLNIAAAPDIYTPAMTVIPAARFLVEQNLFENIGTCNRNMLVLMNNLSDLTISHNTMNYNYAEGLMATMESLPILASARNIVMNDNVVTKGRYYQLFHSGIKVGIESMNAFAGSRWAFNRNVVIGVDTDYVSYHPQSSFYPTTMAQVGFSASSNGDYRLSPSSPYKGRAPTERIPARTSMS